MTLQPQHTVIAVYAAFGICLITSCIPNMSIQNYSALFTIILQIAAYFLRRREEPDSFAHNHIDFIIRTIWIWSLFFVIGMAGAGMMISQSGDMSALDQLMSSVTDGSIPTEADMNQTAQVYFETNYALILRTTLLWLGPAQLYAVWRIARGLSRALKGYRLANPRSWF